MPASRWHHISVRDPKQYKIVGTIQLGRTGGEEDRSDHGIQARIGRKGRSATKWVTLLFDPRLWTAEEAVAWVRKHGEKIREVAPAPEQPGYKLTSRAHGLHKGREAVELRDVLKKHGLGVALTIAEANLVPGLVKALGRSVTADMLSCGLFLSEDATAGPRALVALPPQTDILKTMRDELEAFADAETGHAAAGLALKIRSAAGRLSGAVRAV